MTSEETSSLLNNNKKTPAIIPRGTVVMMIVEFLERTAYYGTVFSFVTYGIVMLGLDARLATVVLQGVFGIAPLSALFCAFLADCGIGRVKVLLVAVTCYMLGMSMVTLSASPYAFHSYPEDPSMWGMITFAIGAVVLSVGYGGYKTCAGPLMADCVLDQQQQQIQQQQHINEGNKKDDETKIKQQQNQQKTQVLLSRVWNTHYWIFNVGATIGLTAFQYARRLDGTTKHIVQRGHNDDSSSAEKIEYTAYYITFAIGVACSLLGILVFLFQSHHFPQHNNSDPSKLKGEIISLKILWAVVKELIAGACRCCCCSSRRHHHDVESTIHKKNEQDEEEEDSAQVQQEQQGDSTKKDEEEEDDQETAHSDRGTEARSACNRHEEERLDCPVCLTHDVDVNDDDSQPHRVCIIDEEQQKQQLQQEQKEDEEDKENSEAKKTDLSTQQSPSPLPDGGGDDDPSSSHHLYHQEALKSMRRDVISALKACRMFLPLPLHWVCQSQTGSNMLVQSMCLNMPGGIPPVLLNNLSTAALLIAIPIINLGILFRGKVILWARRKKKNKEKKKNLRNGSSEKDPLVAEAEKEEEDVSPPPPPRVSTRMAIGFLISVSAMLWAIWVQIKIDRVATLTENGRCIVHSSTTTTTDALPSGLWLFPCYILGGIAQAFADPSALEGAYYLAPKRMKSAVMAGYLLASSCSGWTGVILSPLATPRLFITLYGVLGGALAVLTVVWKIWMHREGV